MVLETNKQIHVYIFFFLTLWLQQISHDALVCFYVVDGLCDNIVLKSLSVRLRENYILILFVLI